MNIKRKLGLGALVLGISGCCSGGRYDSAEFPEVPEVQNISTDVIAFRPEEKVSEVQNISTDVITSRPEKRYVVNTSNLSCVQADVIMGAWGYEIECDGRRLLFRHLDLPGYKYKYFDIDSESLMWSCGNHYMTYIDYNSDGKADHLSVDGVEVTVSDGLNDQYRATLGNLGKDKVQKLWEEHWRPNSCK